MDSEAIGRARDFMRRVQAEYETAHLQFNNALMPILERKRRHPLRGFRKGQLLELADKLEAMPNKFQIALRLYAHNIKNPTEMQIVWIYWHLGHLKSQSWTNGELNLICSAINVTLKARLKPYEELYEEFHFAVVSLHALARRYERSIERSDEAVIRDLMKVYYDPNFTSLEFTIRTLTGEWRAFRAEIEGLENHPNPEHSSAQVCVRTYVSRWETDTEASVKH